MEFREVAYLVMIIVGLQIGIGALIFFLSGSSAGVDLELITISILILALIATLIGVSLYWIINRYTKERAIKTAIMAMSEDEEKVLREVMNRGSARQDELRRDLGFSKSKLSALLKNLVEKNAVEKVRYKRTNKIKPTEQFKR